MPEVDLIELFVHPLQEAGISYLISGSVAVMLGGEPRETHDIHLVFLRRVSAEMARIFPRV